MVHMSQAAPSGNEVGQLDKVGKFEVRREELADAALETLSELGFARTSLREIAANTEFSHGVLHYYFQDKVELITYCLKRYYEGAAGRYDGTGLNCSDPDELIEAVAAAMVGALVEHPNMQRLWYDVRAQSLYEPALVAMVQRCEDQLESMIWGMTRRLADLSGTQPVVSSQAAYALISGLFEGALRRFSSGDDEAPEALRRDVRATLRGFAQRP